MSLTGQPLDETSGLTGTKLSGTKQWGTKLSGTESSVAIPAEIALFDADFARLGDALVVSDAAGHDFRIDGFFGGVDFPALVAGNGAELRGDIAARLAGSAIDAMVAQSGPVASPEAIGQVERLSGNAQVQRTDGQTESLAVGDKIFANDILLTATDSTLSVTFADGTIFSMASNARMVIDELVYEPLGAGNSAAFNLISGGFVFIAGQVAETGDMNVTTPAATMGIRGTTVSVFIELVNGIAQVTVALNPDPDGEIGTIELRDLEGELIAIITATDTMWIVSPIDGETREVPRTEQDFVDNEALLNEAFAAYQLATQRVQSGEEFVNQGDGSNPRQSPTVPEDGTPQIEIDPGSDSDLSGPNAVPLQFEQQQGGAPLEENGQTEEGDGSGENDELDGGTDAFDETDVDNIRFNPEDEEDGSSPQDPSDPDPDQNPDSGQNPDTVPGPTPGPNPGPNPGQNPDPGPIEGQDPTIIPPPDAIDASLTGPEDLGLSGQVTAETTQNNALTFAIETAPANGSVVMTEDGAFVYQPNADFFGSDSFTYRVTDDLRQSDIGIVSITVLSVPDAPLIDAAQSVLTGVIGEDYGDDYYGDYYNEAALAAPALVQVEPGEIGETPETVSGLLVFSDVDIGDSFFVTAQPSGEGALGDISFGEVVETATPGTFSVVWTYSISPDAYGSISADEVVTERFDLIVQDTDGLSASIEAEITVIGVNDPPIAEADAVIVDPANPVDIDPLANDRDPDGDPLTLVSVTEAANGQTFVTEDGLVRYIPNEGFFGGDRFEYVVTDSFGATATGTISVLVEQDPQQGEFPFEGVPATVDFVGENNESGEPIGSFTVETLPSEAFYAEFGLEASFSEQLFAASGPLLYDQVFDETLEFQLVGFSVFQETDGVFLGQVGDISSLQEIGDNVWRFTVADIPLLPLTIGEVNNFAAAGSFDFLGTPSDTSDDLFVIGEGTLSKADSAQTTFGTEKSDVILGSDLGDLLGGSDGSDLMLGFGGDDTIRVSSTDVRAADGGEGRDILQVLLGGEITGSILNAFNARNFEAIDLSNETDNLLAINSRAFDPDDEASISDIFRQDELLDQLLTQLLPADQENGQTATIYGEEGDTVRLANDASNTFNKVEEISPIDDGLGNQLNIFRLEGGSGEVLATLGIDTDVSVNIVTA